MARIIWEPQSGAEEKEIFKDSDTVEEGKSCGRGSDTLSLVTLYKGNAIAEKFRNPHPTIATNSRKHWNCVFTSGIG